MSPGLLPVCDDMGKFKKQDLIYLLKLEVSIIEGGNYGRPVLMPWRNITILRDCVTCLNVSETECRHSCNDCFLLEHVPESRRQEKVPCHFIPLNDKGDTIATLEERGHRKEAEKALLNWIRATIKKLEEEPD